MNTNKPDWEDAPDWANWLAQDMDGEWYWYERDVVKNPKHYQILPGVELIDIRESLLDKIEEADILDARQLDCWSRSWEYLTRFAEKGGHQDLEKAYHYLHRLLHGEWPK